MKNMQYAGILSLLIPILGGCGAHVSALNPPQTPSPSGVTPMGTISYSDADCLSLHNKTIAYTATAAALAALSGGTGLTTAVFTDSTPRYITGTTSLTVGVTAAVIAVLEKFASDDFSAGCKVTPGQ
jgi:hypothetical protein